MFELRKTAVYVETISHDGGAPADRPITVGAIGGVVKNPYAGQYVDEFDPDMPRIRELGLELTNQLIAAMGCQPSDIEAYGKGAIVGEAGELEHCALWHVPGGYAMRAVLGEAKAIVPSAVKMGGPGTSLDLPLHHVNAAYVRSHFSAIELRIPDAPKSDEIVFAFAMSNGGRVHARMGGLAQADIKGEDGLR